MNFDPNPLYFEMAKIYSQNKTEDNRIIICNEGSSRSSKTWDTFHLIYTFCDHNRNKGLEIFFLRETMIRCKDSILIDWIKFLKVICCKDYEYIKSPTFTIYGNTIIFRGFDDDAEGYPSDILFFNEALEIKKKNYDDLIMRCRKLAILDWNPKYTAHWCFDLEGQDDVYFTRSTFRQNKHLEKAIVNGFHALNPFEENSTYVDNHKLMYNGREVSNIEQGTADLFRYKVYNLGLRGAMEGLIFPNVFYIDKMPDLAVTYGQDFGFTADPTVLVRYAQEGRNIYLEPLLYSPTETSDILIELYRQLELPLESIITCDSSDKHVSENNGTVEMVRSLRLAGYSARKVLKTMGLMFWILEMKKFKIHIIKNNLYKFVKKEAENYIFKEINGIKINQPKDDFNHFWDASRYAFMAYNKNLRK